MGERRRRGKERRREGGGRRREGGGRRREEGKEGGGEGGGRRYIEGGRRRGREVGLVDTMSVCIYIYRNPQSVFHPEVFARGAITVCSKF